MVGSARTVVRLVVATMLLGGTASCAAGPAVPESARAANGAARHAFETHADNVELTIDGVVDRVLADQSGPSGPHERFIVRLTDVDLTVLIEHNLAIAPRVPVSVGERVSVHGEYVWNAQGGLLHFTHHDPQRSHEAGYIDYAGRRYE